MSQFKSQLDLYRDVSPFEYPVLSYAFLTIPIIVNKGEAMNRAEKEDKVQKQDGKIFEISNLAIDVRCLHPNYSLLKPAIPALKDTGLLCIFKLQPKFGDGFFFLGRWDGGSRDQGKVKREDLDIDIGNVPKVEQHRFENGENGYAGHHSIRIVSTAGRAYKVTIRTAPDNMIFDGTVYFSVHRKMEFQAGMASFAATMDAKAEGSSLARTRTKIRA